MKDEKNVAPLKHGGTDMHLESPDMLPFLSDRLKSGTPNLMDVGGLIGGINYIKKRGIENIYRHEMNLTNRFFEGLKTMDHVSTYGHQSSLPQVSVVSLNVRNLSPQKVSEHLEKRRKSGCVPASTVPLWLMRPWEPWIAALCVSVLVIVTVKMRWIPPWKC